MNQSSGCPFKVDISDVPYLAKYLVEVFAITSYRLLDTCRLIWDEMDKVG